MKIITSLFLLLTLSSSPSLADTCGRLPPVGNLNDVGGYYLILQSRFGSYVVNKDCALLSRSHFAKKIQFKILPTGTGEQTTVFVRSYRTLSQPQLLPIKMSRGGSWLMPDTKSGNDVPLDKLRDEPYAGSASDWDTAHSSAGTPQVFSERLRALWHAYAGASGTLPSTVDLPFWLISTKYDLSHATLTNYLLTFPAKSQSPIPFEVYLQDAVSEVALTLSSRDESLSGTYKFVISD
ncbi:MAG: hypothetical protein QOD09_5166 [Bradyrhizobium sp.]|jgi:hypothetical protein|nr:hypothetical protein [Bradyrhizobium sp.]